MEYVHGDAGSSRYVLHSGFLHSTSYLIQHQPSEQKNRRLPYSNLAKPQESWLMTAYRGFAIELDSLLRPVPELINNSPETAPSKRLIAAIPDYNKVVVGICVAMDIGLEKIREKCPLFNEWVERLMKWYLSMGDNNTESCWHHCRQDSVLFLLFLICRLQIELYRTLLWFLIQHLSAALSLQTPAAELSPPEYSPAG